MVIGKCTDVFRGIILVWGAEAGWLRGRIFIGEEKFHEGDAGFSSIIKKNNEKIHSKKFFF